MCFGELESADLERIPEGCTRLEVISVPSFCSERNLYTTLQKMTINCPRQRKASINSRIKRFNSAV